MAKKGTLEVKVLGDSSHFDKVMKGLGPTAGVAFKAAGLAAGAFAGFSVKAFGDFDAKLQQSVAIMGDVSDEMRGNMSDAAREIGKTTKFSAAEAAESYFFLASAGMSAEQSIAALPAVASFAQAGMFDMATATDLATDAQSALGLAVEDPAENLANLTRVTDVFVKANTLANTSVEQIAEAMTNKAGAAMRAVGMDIEEGSAVLAAFADQGVKGAEAGTQFSIVMRDLQTKALSNADAFKAAGVEVFDANGEFKNMADIIGDLEGRLGGMSDAQKKAELATLGFSDKSMGSLQTLLGTSDAIREYEGELRNAAGTVDEISNKQMKTFNAQVGLLKDRFMDVAIGVGSVIVPKLLDGFNAIEGWWSRNGPAITAFVKGVADAINEWVTVALAALAAWWDVNGDAIVTKVTDIWEAITGWIEDVGPAIMSWVDDVLGHLSEWWDVSAPIIATAAETLRVALVDAIDLMVEAIQFVVDEWDKFKVAIGVAVAIMIPHWVALAAAAVASAATQAGAWLMTRIGAITSAAVHSAQVLIMIAKWALMATKAMAHALKVAAAWVITSAGAIGAAIVMTIQTGIMIARWAAHATAAMASALVIAAAWVIALGPVALLAAAVVAAVALIVIHWGTLKRKARELKDSIVANFEALIDFIKGLGGKIRDAAKGLWDGIPSPPSWLGGGLGNLPIVGGVADAFSWATGHGGGIVPGFPGQERLILAEGGETILPSRPGGKSVGLKPLPHMAGITRGSSHSADDLDRLADRIINGLSGQTLVIGDQRVGAVVRGEGDTYHRRNGR